MVTVAFPTYHAAAADLRQRGAGFALIFVPDRRCGHYEVLARAQLGAVPLYQLCALDGREREMSRA